mgnify:CR=1 FL=1|tara:strand:- start:11127 stop:11294 length:168 start_codon:yes stop_codon:yes gene_type:complete
MKTANEVTYNLSTVGDRTSPIFWVVRVEGGVEHFNDGTSDERCQKFVDDFRIKDR